MEPDAKALAQANRHSADGRLEAAAAAYRDALEQRPGDLETLTNLGTTLSRLGQSDGAIAAYRAAIASHPKATEPRLNLAIALTRVGRQREALVEYDALLVESPELTTAHFYRANLLASLNELDAARAAYDHVLALVPDHAEAYCNRGTVALALRDPDGAERDFYAALTRNPGLAEAWQQLAKLFIGARRSADAVAVLTRLAALQPADAETQCRLGQALAANQEPERAAAAFARAIALGGAPLPEALRGLASLQLGRGERRQALRNYARAVALEPVVPWHAASGGRHARVLALVAPGLGNTPIEHLVAASAHQFGMVLVLPGLRYDAARLAERGDLVLNLISDADVGRGVLPHAAALAEQIGRPTINHPAKIRPTDRQTIARRLAALPFCRVPETVRRTRAQLADPVAVSPELPWLIRPVGDHGGARLERVDTAREISDFVGATAGDAFYLTRFVDYRSADGHYRKYRLIFLGDAILPYHLAIGDHWKVHYFRTPMDQHDWMRREEEAFLADHTQVFGSAHAAALTSIRNALDLEFFGIDCGIDRDGALVLFEANASMLIHANDSRALFPYKQASFERIRQAFDLLIQTVATNGTVHHARTSLGGCA
jgi:tetratricopeptide (TPR) repeat protein